MGKIIDITGLKFGRLTVVKYSGISRHYATWECICDCGRIVTVAGVSLRKGNTTSCGCYLKERITQTHRKHGYSGTKIYYVWRAIKKRCTNPADKEFDTYGGRGIKICDEWENDFGIFLSYVSKLPHYGEKGYTIDRIDNDGNYEPGNLRMATYSQQALNRHKKRWTKKPGLEV